MHGAPGDDGGTGVSRTIDHNTMGHMLKAAIINILILTM